MIEYDDARILIISNNVISYNKNNGKTILSYFENFNKSNVRQLYFSNEIPEIAGFNYFQLSDRDVIKGRFDENKRGRVIHRVTFNNEQYKHKDFMFNKEYGDIARLCREIIWIKAWKSKHLLKWLDEFKPNIIFFVAGDCLFSYNIYIDLIKRYKGHGVLYITDDYVESNKNDNIIRSFRKKLILKKISESLSYTSSFCTISNIMRSAYVDLFGRDSFVVVNMPETMKLKKIMKNNDSIIRFIYAGSLYYGRRELLTRIADTLLEYKKENPNVVIRFDIYSNNCNTDFKYNELCEFKKGIAINRLKLELNQSDVLVFCESFNPIFIDKTKYSLSTKIPEYLSLGKPILTVGPSMISSINYLSDVSYCIDSEDLLKEGLYAFLNNREKWAIYSSWAEKKFQHNHDKDKNLKLFISKALNIRL